MFLIARWLFPMEPCYPLKNCSISPWHSVFGLWPISSDSSFSICFHAARVGFQGNSYHRPFLISTFSPFFSISYSFSSFDGWFLDVFIRESTTCFTTRRVNECDRFRSFTPVTQNRKRQTAALGLLRAALCSRIACEKMEFGSIKLFGRSRYFSDRTSLFGGYVPYFLLIILVQNKWCYMFRKMCGNGVTCSKVSQRLILDAA